VVLNNCTFRFNIEWNYPEKSGFRQNELVVSSNTRSINGMLFKHRRRL